MEAPFATQSNSVLEPTPPARLIPAAYESLKIQWDRAAYRWQIFAVMLSTGAVLAGLGVTVAVQYQSFKIAWLTTTLGFVAAGCAALTSVIRPVQYGNRYRTAWRMLNVACLRYQYDHTVPVASLCNTVARCELIIGDIELGAVDAHTI